MNYFNPDRLPSSGKSKYKIAVDVSDKHGLIRTFYYSISADSEESAIEKAKNELETDSYISGDHLARDYRNIGEIALIGG